MACSHKNLRESACPNRCCLGIFFCRDCGQMVEGKVALYPLSERLDAKGVPESPLIGGTPAPKQAPDARPIVKAVNMTPGGGANVEVDYEALMAQPLAEVMREVAVHAVQVARQETDANANRTAERRIPGYSEIKNSSVALSKALNKVTDEEEREAVFGLQRLIRDAITK